MLSLGHLKQLYLLPKLFSDIVIPHAVLNELLQSRLAESAKKELQTSNWLKIQSPNSNALSEKYSKQGLHFPEAQAICLAKEMNANFVLIDEQVGRAIAAREGLQVVGILGVLLKAKQEQLIPAVKPLIDVLMTQTGFRISPKLYLRVLQNANEI